MALNPKQARFVAEYLIDLNATQAAIRAGYSAKTAKQIGSKLLTNIDVASEVSKRQEKIAKDRGITVDSITRELAKLGFSNMQDYLTITNEGDPQMDLSNLTRDQAAALAEVTVEDFKDGRGDAARDVRRIKFKLADKRAALVDLGKHLGMFKETSQAQTAPTIINKIYYGQPPVKS